VSYRPIAPTLVDYTPPPPWSVPSWSVAADVVGPEAVAPAPGSARLVAVLAVVAAGLMSASLWLSVASQHHRGHPSDTTLASAATFGGGAAAYENDPPELLSEAALPAPAPTLTVPRRPTVIAPRAALAVVTPDQPDASPASRSETPEDAVSVAPVRADGRLEQARRTARLLREQLGSSGR
jgi:hypothetical protein